MLHARVGGALGWFFFFQAEDGIRDKLVTGVQTCALPISSGYRNLGRPKSDRWAFPQCATGPSRRLCGTYSNQSLSARSEERRVDLGGRRIIKKKKRNKI